VTNYSQIKNAQPSFSFREARWGREDFFPRAENQANLYPTPTNTQAVEMFNLKPER
jgi:hypothetical protein